MFIAKWGGHPARLKRAVTFSLAAVTSSVVVYAGIGVLGWTPLWWLGALLVLPTSAYGLRWHSRVALRSPRWRRDFQANRSTVDSGRAGLAYFGAVLGPGLLTTLGTPLVLAGAALSLMIGPIMGLVYGFGFGIGRVLPTMVAAFRREDPRSPHAVALAFLTPTRVSRAGGSVAAVATLLLAVAQGVGRG